MTVNKTALKKAAATFHPKIRLSEEAAPALEKTVLVLISRAVKHMEAEKRTTLMDKDFHRVEKELGLSSESTPPSNS